MGVRLGTLVVVALVLSASACGAGGDPTATPSPAQTQASGSASPINTKSPVTGDSQLTIVVDDGTGTPTTWTLTCDPAGGTHPDPDGACTALADHRTALDPVPQDKMCAQVYGGPERATITGTWQDQPVMAALSRVNSCETARWDALVPLVPAAGQ